MQKVISKLSYQFSQGRRTKLHIYEGQGPNNVSGISSTIYGATGFLGPYIGATLGQMGSDIIFPHNYEYLFNDEVKELKLCAVTGQSVLIRDMNFDNKDMIDWTMVNSNVVINLLGPRSWIKDRKDFEYINITVPKRLAEACAKNPGVLRFIHFSAAGASKDSESLDLQTKYFGEQEVLQAFPNATILKPCTVVGMNDNFVRKWITQREYFHHFNLVYDDCKAKRQPILVNDVALALLNALKLPETAGRTYELGGPNVYSMLEAYDILHNYIEQPPKLAYFNKQLALQIARVIPNWTHFSMEMVIKHGLDMICSEGSRQIDELYVRPVSFPQMLPLLLADQRRRPQGQRELDER